MKIYIQSRSGDLNTNTVLPGNNLERVLYDLRDHGGYYAKFRKDKVLVFVPFEEILYISVDTEQDEE